MTIYGLPEGDHVPEMLPETSVCACAVCDPMMDKQVAITPKMSIRAFVFIASSFCLFVDLFELQVLFRRGRGRNGGWRVVAAVVGRKNAEQKFIARAGVGGIAGRPFQIGVSHSQIGANGFQIPDKRR